MRRRAACHAGVTRITPKTRTRKFLWRVSQKRDAARREAVLMAGFIFFLCLGPGSSRRRTLLTSYPVSDVSQLFLRRNSRRFLGR